MKQKHITKSMQKEVISILEEFYFVKTLDDFVKVYDSIMKKYDLYGDPFTGLPVSFEEYLKNSIELEKQIMIEKYGHCDGLE